MHESAPTPGALQPERLVFSFQPPIHPIIPSPTTMTDNDRAPEAERTVTLKKVEVHSGAGLVHVNLTTSLTTPMPKIV